MSARASDLRNNFDLLRFLLAAIVVLFHLRVLSGQPEFDILRSFADGGAAVLGFFSISGYVVSLSFLRSSSWRDYTARRCRRLLPAYLVVVSICFLSGAWLSTFSSRDYWTSAASWKYLAANLTFMQFLQPNLPGVFTNNPALSAVNGSLWSIRTEVLCYVLVPVILGIAHSYTGAALMAGIAILIFPLSANPSFGSAGSLAQMAIAQPLESFFFGIWIATLSHPRKTLVWGGAVGAALLLLAHTNPGLALFRTQFFQTQVWRGPLLPAAVASVVLCMALEMPYLGDWSRLGNLSYGIYLWHFPLIQVGVSQGSFARTPWLAAAATAIPIAAFAAASWYLVERTALRRRAIHRDQSVE